MALLDKLKTLRDGAVQNPLRTLVFVFVLLGAAPRLWQMIFDQGVFWPDEIYQTVEQGHRMAFGYGFIPWEFRDGARSWMFPGLVGVLLKLVSFVGVTSSPVGVVMTVRVAMLALALWGVYGAMRLGNVVGGLLGAFLAGTAAALCPPLIVYGTRCMTEMASGPLLMIGAVIVVECDRASAKRGAIAGALCGLAIFFRYQNGLFALAYFLILLTRRAWRPALGFAIAGVFMGCVGGILDWITWGRPFHSFIAYVNFNLIEGKSAKWGVESYEYFLKTFRTSFGPAAWLVAVGFVLSFARQRVLPIACLINLAIHSAIPHKEFRFLTPMLPIVLALAGAGYGWLLGGLLAKDTPRETRSKLTHARIRAGGWIATVLALTMGVLFVRRVSTITFGAMGQDLKGRDDGYAPWNHEAGPNLALWEAGRHDDICGITVVGTPVVSMGGYTYLHKNVPIFGGLSSFELASANYIAAPRLMVPPSGYSVVKSFPVKIRLGERTDGKKNTPPDWDYVLFRREGTCTKPPPYWQPHLS